MKLGLIAAAVAVLALVGGPSAMAKTMHHRMMHHHMMMHHGMMHHHMMMHHGMMHKM